VLSIALLKPQVSVTQAVLVAGVPGWPVILTGWPVTVAVVKVGVVDTRYGVSQPGADAERYRRACLHGGWLGMVQIQIY